MKKGEHGPDKLYNKFRVFRNKTGEELTNRGEFIFVLRPETNDRAAWEALRTYAIACEGSYPELAQDIMAELTRIRSEVDEILLNSMPPLSVDEAYRLRADERPPPPMTIRRTKSCVYCGSGEDEFCHFQLEGKQCLLELGNA